MGFQVHFRGPHASFTKANGNVKTDITHAIYHARNQEIINPWLDRKIEYALPVDKKFNITLYPTPLSEKDVIDAGEVLSQPQNLIVR